MDADEFDLNLLRVLDAVLSEQSVTRAARRLHLSQPAVSHSLRRLRACLGDPLIERVGRTMRITPEGRRLQGEVAEILRQVRRTIGPQDFDPATTTRRFALAVPDPVAIVLLPRLAAHLRSVAPQARLEIQLLHSVRTPGQMTDGTLDAAISVAGSFGPHFRSSPLTTLPWKPVVGRRARESRTPIPMTLDEFVARPHAVVTRSRANDLVEATLAAHGLRRHIALVADSDLILPTLLQGTDLIGLALAPSTQHPDLRVVELPIPLASSTFHLWWNPGAESDLAHAWFLAQLVSLVAESATARAPVRQPCPPSR